MELDPQGLLVGVVAIAIGLALLLRGFQLFLILLPAIGFLGGFLLGASIVEALLGESFLATLTGWLAGFGLGVLFAALSYLYYWAAVGLFGGVLGYQVAVGLLAWIGFDDQGALAVVVGLLVAVIAGVAFLVLQMPTVLAIVGTSILSAGATAAGLAVGLGLVPTAQLDEGIFGLYSSSELGWIGVLLLAGLALGGMVYQARRLTDDDQLISPDSFRNPSLGGPGAPSGTATA